MPSLVGDLSFSEEKEGQVDGARRSKVGGRDWKERRKGEKTVVR